MFVGFDCRWHAVEIKIPKKGRLQHTQVMWAAATKGCYHVIKTTEDVIELIEDWKSGNYALCQPITYLERK